MFEHPAPEGIIFWIALILVIIFYLISMIRYYISKKKYLANLNETTESKFKSNRITYYVSTFFLIALFLTTAFLLKEYIIAVVGMMLYVFSTIRFFGDTDSFNKNNKNDIFLTILSIMFTLFCIFWLSMTILISAALTGLFEKPLNTFNDAVKVVAFIATPSENSKNEAINGLNGLIDLHNEIVKDEYKIDKEKVTNVVEDVLTPLVSTNSEISTEKLAKSTDEILNVFISSISEINEDDVGNLIDSYSKIITGINKLN